jgi:hypothetical protein
MSMVLRPLCVAAPLAKKRASMYRIPPDAKTRRDPTIERDIMYM